MGTPALQIGDDYELGIKGYHDLKNGQLIMEQNLNTYSNKKYYCTHVAVSVQPIPYHFYRIWDILLLPIFTTQIFFHLKNIKTIRG